ncbi:unnamed protein product [Strongylus vulgaris]|uniref:C2H2-type domain-containing protein n=1 Tax=Strongylus vulgaris TaxID=40348 RepID=A0A3P7LKC5_STRVU|nr:unnamed protein product [Strongylus vulgaris]
MRGHLSDRDESRCPRCPLLFNDGQARLAHMISHFEIRKPLRTCTECRLPFADSMSLGQHFMEQHLKLQHLCTVCRLLPSGILGPHIEPFKRGDFAGMWLLEQPFDKSDSAPIMLRNGTILSPTIQKEVLLPATTGMTLEFGFYTVQFVTRNATVKMLWTSIVCLAIARCLARTHVQPVKHHYEQLKILRNTPECTPPICTCTVLFVGEANKASTKETRK